MKICLINPPNIFKKQKGYIWSPNIFTLPYLGIGYITSYLIKNNYETVQIDCPLQDYSVSSVCKALEDGQYDVIGISIFYYNLIHAKQIIKFVKHKFKKAFIFVGGFLPTLDYSTLLSSDNNIDCCIIGAGEKTALSLVKALDQECEWRNIEGIAYKKDSAIFCNPKEPLGNNLDFLPFPYRCNSLRSIAHVSMLSSRGCYGNCTFCGEKEYSVANSTLGINYRSVDNVIKEICYLKGRYNFTHLRFNDSDFLDGSQQRHDWLIEFCNQIEEKNLCFEFTCNSRANDIIRHEDILEKLSLAGLKTVFIGIESFVQRQLDLYSKKTHVADNFKALEILKEANIKVEIGLIIIEPYTTMDEIIVNIDSILNSSFFDIVDITQSFISGACTLISIPGTRIYNQIKDAGLFQKNELGYEIIDKNVYLLHQILTEWNKFISLFAKEKYKIYKAVVERQVAKKEFLLSWLKRMLIADVQFMKKTSIFIIERKIDSSNFSTFIQNEFDNFKNLHNEIMREWKGDE